MITLQVDLGARSYPIHIGRNLLGRADLVAPVIRGRQVMIVTNETVAPLYLDRASRAFADRDCRQVILPDGERFKTLETVTRVFDALLEARFDRRCALVALGGGVIGDITGFAAACYQRGVDFVQLPTTLLAQVDSSVGGKTGVNHPQGKNMVGAFHQPRCVIVDTATLETLDDRQLAAGVAEVIKYGLINDAPFFAWLEDHVEALMARDSEALAYAIERSCANKAAIVAADEHEQGQRALLNLGHTFGHAIEAGMGYGNWLHGEAVAAGSCMAVRFSRRLDWLDDADVERIETLFRRAGLPVRAPRAMSAERFLDLMAVDKKVLDGVQRLVLLRAIGEGVISADFGVAALRGALVAEARDAGA